MISEITSISSFSCAAMSLTWVYCTVQTFIHWFILYVGRSACSKNRCLFYFVRMYWLRDAHVSYAIGTNIRYGCLFSHFHRQRKHHKYQHVYCTPKVTLHRSLLSYSQYVIFHSRHARKANRQCVKLRHTKNLAVLSQRQNNPLLNVQNTIRVF